MIGLYISIFVILANILFICAIYSCIKVSNKAKVQALCSRYVTVSLMLLTHSLFLLLSPAFSSFLTDGHQENCPVSFKQHIGGRFHHPPPLHLVLC